MAQTVMRRSNMRSGPTRCLRSTTPPRPKIRKTSTKRRISTKQMTSTIRSTTIRTTLEHQLLGRSMKRAFNFSAGPAALPLEVLQEAAAELYDYRGTGMSVMEMSHRSDEFVDIARRAEADLRELLTVPDEYAV